MAAACGLARQPGAKLIETDDSGAETLQINERHKRLRQGQKEERMKKKKTGVELRERSKERRAKGGGKKVSLRKKWSANEVMLVGMLTEPCGVCGNG